ncbi:MAG: phosphate ABC transporter substrate-binding protein PstS [Gemmatirosa sp.]
MKRLVYLAAVALLAACGSEQKGDVGGSGGSSGAVDLTGAGATFPYPLYSKWFSEYAAQKSVRINYQSIGSGGGIRQLSEQTVDFGASDAPMTDEEMAKAKGGPIVHIPTVLGAVVVTYNVPELQQPVRLTGEALADIFLGRITKWNAPQLAALNPGMALPARDILVVRRSDGSGTSYIFTDYLAAVSPAWAAGPGKGKEVRWPVGLGGKGNEGVAGQVKSTPGTIGYVELAYATQNQLPVAAIHTASGNFVTPSIESVTAAAAGGAERLPENSDYRVSIVNAPGAQAYPISSLTWLLVYETQRDSVKGRKLVEFLGWALHDGARYAAPLDYAPLPPALVQRLDRRIATLRVAAQP